MKGLFITHVADGFHSPEPKIGQRSRVDLDTLMLSTFPPPSSLQKDRTKQQKKEVKLLVQWRIGSVLDLQVENL
jgi:hypothetical protein